VLIATIAAMLAAVVSGVANALQLSAFFGGGPISKTTREPVRR
jgi:hypothetical protein